MIVAVLIDMKEEAKMVQATWTQLVNWCGYRSGIIIQTTQEDLNDVAETIELPEDVKLAVVEEGRLPTCYCCGQKRHIKREVTPKMPK